MVTHGVHSFSYFLIRVMAHRFLLNWQLEGEGLSISYTVFYFHTQSFIFIHSLPFIHSQIVIIYLLLNSL